MEKFGYNRIYDIDFLLDLNKTTHFSELISLIVKLTNCQSYLELGVDKLDTISVLKHVVKKCVGVDILNVNIDGVDFYNMTTDDFFKVNNDNFDVIFIDADHKFESVKKDLENSLKILNEFGIIILHDTDPIHEKLVENIYCSDSYKIVTYIYSEHPELNIITFPINETGLSFVMRRKDKRISKFL